LFIVVEVYYLWITALLFMSSLQCSETQVL